MADLPVIGNRLVLQDADKYIANAKSANKQIAETNQLLSQQSKAAANVKLPDHSKQVKGIFDRIAGLAKSFVVSTIKSIQATINGILNLLKTAITAPFKVITELTLATLKAVAIGYVAKVITEAVTGDTSKITKVFNILGKLTGQGFKDNFSSAISKGQELFSSFATSSFGQEIGKRLKPVGEAIGSETGQRLIVGLQGAVQKYLPSFITGKLFKVALNGADREVAKFATNVGTKFQETATKFDGLTKVIEGLRGKIKGLEDQLKEMAEKGAEAAGKVAEVGKQGATELAQAVPFGQQLTKVLGSISTAFAKGFGPVNKAFSGFGAVVKVPIAGLKGVSSVLNLIPATAQKAVLAIGALAAGLIALQVGIAVVQKLGQVFSQLGKRSADIIGIAEAFDYMAAAANQTSTALLGKLRVASAGMISDFELMKQANIALAGASVEVAQAIGENLPKLLEIARAQARATGQDVDFLFESLVTGVKRSSPLLIDNTGLTLDVGKANEEYAKSLGVTVEQLTEQQKQIALLNATIEAGQPSIDRLNKSQQTANEVNAQTSAIMQNAKDRLALIIGPLYLTFARVKKAFAEAFSAIIDFMAPLFNAFVERANVITRIVGDIFRAIGRFLAPILNELKYVMAAVVLGMTAFTKALSLLWDGVMWVFDQIGSAIKWLVDGLTSIFPFLKAFRDGIFLGTVRAFGAMAAGILWVANTLIFPAIIGIAEFIADFLLGESPPPKGPLNAMTKGAEAVMTSWLDGFLGVPLIDPISKVTQDIANLMGPIAQYTLEQVQVGLAQLDSVLQPFEDRLNLVKAKVEAITKPLEIAKDLASKRLDKMVQDLTQGKISAGLVRAQDQQLEMINERLSASQEELQIAQLQYELVRAMQGPQRAALELRLRMLQAQQQLNEAQGGDGAGGSEIGADKAGAGGEASPFGGGAGGILSPFGGGILDTLNQSAGGFLGGIWDEITGAFGEGMGTFGQEQLALFGENRGALGVQMGRIGEGLTGLPSRLAQPFADLASTVQGHLDSLLKVIEDFFGLEDGSIVAVFDAALLGIDTAFKNTFGAEGTVPSALRSMGNFFKGLDLNKILVEPFNDATKSIGDGFNEQIYNENGDSALQNTFNSVSDWISTIWKLTGIGPALDGIFGAGGLFEAAVSNESTIWNAYAGANGAFKSIFNSAAGWLAFDAADTFQGAFDTIFGAEGVLTAPFREGGAMYQLFEGAESIWQTTLGAVVTFAKDIFKVDLDNVFNSIFGTEGTFNNLFGTGNIFMAIFGEYGIFANAIKEAFNAIITMIEGGVYAFMSGLGSLAKQLNDLDPGGLFPDKLVGAFNISPTWLHDLFPQAREGGLFTSGVVQVHKDELIAAVPGRQLAVFPQDLSRQLMAAVNPTAPFTPPVLSGGGMYGGNSNQRNLDIDIHNYHPTDTGMSLVSLKNRLAMRGY